MTTAEAESAPREGLAVTYRLSRDWSYEERRRRLQRAYALLLGLEPWPPGTGDDEEEERRR